MWGKVIAAVLVTVVVQHVLRFSSDSHPFQETFNHAPGPCKRLPSVVQGAEDASLLPNGLLYVSSGFDKPGKLLRFDFDSDLQDTEEFRIEGDVNASSLTPHGISTWRNPQTGEVHLFVVNHHKDGERVEVFKHDGSKQSKVLKHDRTIIDPKITFLNDLVATGPDSFFATIFCSLPSIALEYFLMYPGGAVLHYDGGKVSVLETGLRMGNGINISPDKKYLYVVEGGTGSLRIYTIQDDNSITLKQTFSFGTGLDNVEVNQETGELWIGAHPNGYKIAQHISFPEAHYVTGSQVLRATVNEGTVTSVREVYSNDGSELMGSSVAVPYKNKLFIGTVIEGALICDLIYPG